MDQLSLSSVFIYFYFSFLGQGSYDMTAGYIDTTFAFAIGLTGYYWFATYKIYEKKGEKRQLVFCQNAKISMFTVKNRNTNRQVMNNKKDKN